MVRTKSFTATAENFYLTQAAVSQQIKKLSEAVNHDLFYYDKKLLKLTVYGSALYHYARRMVELESELKNDLSRIDGTQALYIGVHDTFYKDYLVEVLVEFHKEQPQCPINVLSLGTKDILEWVNTGQLDLGILVAYDTNTTTDSTFLKTENLVWLCSKSKQILKNSTIPFALLGKNSRIEDEGIKQAAKNGLAIEKVFTCTTYLFVEELIKRGAAISILPETCYDPEQMTILSEQDGFPDLKPMDIHMVRSSNSNNSTASMFERAIINHFIHGAEYA